MGVLIAVGYVQNTGATVVAARFDSPCAPEGGQDDTYVKDDRVKYNEPSGNRPYRLNNSCIHGLDGETMAVVVANEACLRQAQQRSSQKLVVVVVC